jgi:hypothetical protein
LRKSPFWVCGLQSSALQNHELKEWPAFAFCVDQASMLIKVVVSDPKPGRPRTMDEPRELVLKLARQNNWGCTGMLGDFRKPWIKTISRQTMKMIQKEHDIDPCPKRCEGSCDELIRIHTDTLW